MKTPTITMTITNLLRASLFLVLLFVFQLMSPVQGQSLDSASLAELPDVCTPVWGAGPDLPSTGVRLVGIYFTANGRFYGMGGRASDTAGSDFTHPFEYNPTTNAWVTKAATYPDLQVNNMACGILTDAGTPYIYCVGGSQAGQTTSSSRVFRYNPATDAITAVAAPWPGNANGITLPGGFAVLSNKLYIIGGFQINTGMSTAIWEFTPGTNAWVQKSSVLPTPLGYVPATTIGSFIYTAGGSTWDATNMLLVDNNSAFKYNPATNALTAITNIPRATAETRALNYGGKMYVMGGGRTAPNPSNEVDVYDPATNAWTTAPAFSAARRNFPTDTDGTRIWLAGGYDSSGTTPLSTMEIFQCNVPVPSGAVSRKTHGGAGNFDVPLPLTGTTGVEPRTGGATNDFTMVVTFGASVSVTGTPQAQVISGSGCVGSAGTCSANGAVTVLGSVVTVPLTNIADAQTIMVRLNGVTSGTANGDVVIPMSRLLGDSNGNRSVNAGDVSQVKQRLGQAVSATNFRSDLNANGSINAGDASVAKQNTGHGVP